MLKIIDCLPQILDAFELKINQKSEDLYEKHLKTYYKIKVLKVNQFLRGRVKHENND